MKESTLYTFVALVWLIGAPITAIHGELLYALIKVIIGGIFLILAKISTKEDI